MLCRRVLIEPLEARRLLAASYYVSPLGDDAADGRSPQTAWRTIDRVNGKNWNPGDRILFEGGKTFGVSGAPGSDVILNGGFENGLASWPQTLGTSSSNSTISDDSPHTGSSSLRISGSSPGTRAQDVTASLDGNQTYSMSFWSRATTIGTGDRRVGVSFYLADEHVATYYRGVQASQWAQMRFAFVAPPAFDRALVWAMREGDNSTLFVDDITLHSIPNGLVFTDNDSGTTEHPVIVASYGTGKAIIDAGDGIGLWGGNVAGMSVQNLIFNGSWDATTGTGQNAGVGVEFVNTRNDNSKLEFITIEKVEARGFQWAGIRVGGWTNKSGFRTVLITDSHAHHNGDVGIHIRGEFDKSSTLYANEKVYIARSYAYDNTGIPDKWAHSGNGILLTDVIFGTVERSVAHHNGKFSNYAHGGPVGIWAFDASKITLQYSESFSNKTGSNRDGAGFDLDGGVTSSVMQNNYSHDNDGPGYLLGQFTRARPWGRNIVRYNISQNDARRNSYGAITLTGPAGPYNVSIEHNTIFMSPPISGTASAIRLKYAGTGVALRNNIVQTTGGVLLVDADSAAAYAQLNGNIYWSTGSSFKVRWSGTTYNSLESWRSATAREMYFDTPTGMFSNPLLTAPGTASHLNNAYKLTTLTQYKPLPTSPVIDATVNLPSPFKGYTPPTVDFFGWARDPERSDVGAAQA